jgi:ABC-type nitrate/sulfonate/bicarbonate transport system permease component
MIGAEPLATTARGLRRAWAPLAGRQLETKLIPVLMLVALIGVWQLAAVQLDVEEFVLPSPARIGEVLYNDWQILWPHWLVTLQEMMLGLALAFAVAMVLGYAIAHIKMLRIALYPPLIASQTLPVIAIAPILVIWFGYNIIPKVVVTALIAFFPLAINTVHGYDSVSAHHKRFFRSLRASRLQTFVKLSLPAAASSIFAGLKISATLAVIGATVGEWVGADRGLGHLIVQDTGQLYTARVFAAIALLAASGIALFVVVSIVERIVLPWRRVEFAAWEG